MHRLSILVSSSTFQNGDFNFIFIVAFERFDSF